MTLPINNIPNAVIPAKAGMTAWVLHLSSLHSQDCAKFWDDRQNAVTVFVGKAMAAPGIK